MNVLQECLPMSSADLRSEIERREDAARNYPIPPYIAAMTDVLLDDCIREYVALLKDGDADYRGGSDRATPSGAGPAMP